MCRSRIVFEACSLDPRSYFFVVLGDGLEAVLYEWVRCDAVVEGMS
jgi:hypothetical protein